MLSQDINNYNYTISYPNSTISILHKQIHIFNFTKNPKFSNPKHYIQKKKKKKIRQKSNETNFYKFHISLITPKFQKHVSKLTQTASKTEQPEKDREPCPVDHPANLTPRIRSISWQDILRILPPRLYNPNSVSSPRGVAAHGWLKIGKDRPVDPAGRPVNDERTGCNRLEGVVRLFAREQGKPLSFRTYVSCVGPSGGSKEASRILRVRVRVPNWTFEEDTWTLSTNPARIGWLAARNTRDRGRDGAPPRGTGWIKEGDER